MAQYRLLIIVSLCASLLMVGVGMVVPLLPQRVIALSGSAQSVGYIASVFALAYLILQLPIGQLADRLGAKPFLVLGYLFCCISGLIFFFAQTTEMLLLGRLVQGAGEAPIWALGPALLSLAYPHAKGKVIGIYNAAIHAGLTLGPLLGILLFPSGSSNTPFLIFAGFCFSAGIAALIWLPRPASTTTQSFEQAPSLKSLIQLFKHRSALITLIGILTYGAAYGIFTTVLPAYLVVSKEFGNQAIGVFFALFYLAISISQLIAGPLSDRYGRSSYMVLGLGLAAIGTGLFEVLPYPWTYLPLAIASFGLGVFCVASMAHLNECAPARLKASISGSYYLAWGAGFFIGPIVVAQLSESAEPQLGYYLLALAMLGLGIVLRLERTERKHKCSQL